MKSAPGKKRGYGFGTGLALMTVFLVAAAPANAIRLAHVKHLFDISHGFNAPSDVAVSKDHRIYIVDGVNNQIKVFDYNGRFQSAFGREGSGNGDLRRPLGVDIDTSGRIYVADSGNHRVQIFTPDAGFIAQIPIPPEGRRAGDPTDVAVDSALNRCYVIDNDHHRILVYDLATKKLVHTFGKHGTDRLEFRYPFLGALDRKHQLYVVDVTNTRVQVISAEGFFVAGIGGWGVEKGEFFRPKGVAVDNAGRVFVSDSYMGVIQIFNPNGDFQAAVGDPAAERVKKFRTPVGLFIDDQNRLYVVEMLANRVGVYSIIKESNS